MEKESHFYSRYQTSSQGNSFYSLSHLKRKHLCLPDFKRFWHPLQPAQSVVPESTVLVNDWQGRAALPQCTREKPADMWQTPYLHWWDECFRLSLRKVSWQDVSILHAWTNPWWWESRWHPEQSGPGGRFLPFSTWPFAINGANSKIKSTKSISLCFRQAL